MTIEVGNKRRAIEHVTLPGSLEMLRQQFSDPERLAETLPHTFARLHRSERQRRGSALPDQPRVQVVEAAPQRSEWLVWVADDEKYYGIAEFDNVVRGGGVELQVSIDYEPTQPIVDRLVEWLSHEEVEETLRADLAALRRRLSQSESGGPGES